MATTQNFGFQKFGQEGRLSDNGYRFSLSDRESMDSLFWKLYNHDHAAEGVLDSIPGPTVRPTLTLSTSSGSIPAATNLYYRVSFVDGSGNETQATAAAFVRTPDPIVSPAQPTLATASTGGTLEAGTYRYVLAFYKGATTTRAVNEASVQVPIGTATNTITLTYPALEAGADGWKIYRRAPNEDFFYLLDTVASGPATYVDDGSVAPDCTKKRPTTNTTNQTNSVTIALSASDLPLDTNVGSWRIYRSNNGGPFGANSLLQIVTETVTEGGTDLVTSFVDTGQITTSGAPRQQTAVPPAIPQLDPGTVFKTGSRIPAEFQPQGVQQFYTYIGGALTAKTYNQFYIPNDMLVERVDVFFETGPTGVNGTDNISVRVKDDSLTNEVQHVYNDAAPQDEVQRVSTDATSGTFTLTYDAQVTGPIAFDALNTAVETALELLSNITDVTVDGTGVASDPWIITFLNPGGQNINQMTADSTNLVGGTATVTTSIQGSDGGTFTLSDGTDTTAAIAYNALPATIETRLQTDITAIVDVTVTGAGTSADPWVITYVDPANTDTPTLIADDALLNGGTTVVEVEKGRGNTIIDVVTDTATQYYFWQSSTTDQGTQQAEDAPVTGQGVDVSDSLASNEVAAEIDAQNDVVAWNIGTLDPATYTFGFYVADVDQNSTIKLDVVNLTGPVVLATRTLNSNRGGYEPVYTLEYDIVGTEDVELRVTKTDVGTGRVRVDYFEYQAAFPTLYSGQTGTIEVLVNGTPSTNGDTAHVTIWY